MLKISKDIIVNSTENIIGLDYKSRLGEELTNIFRKAIIFVNKNTDRSLSSREIKRLTSSLNNLYRKSIKNIILNNLRLEVDFMFYKDEITFMTIYKPYNLYRRADDLLSFGRINKDEINYKDDYKKYDIDLGKFIESPVANDLRFVIYFSIWNFLFNYVINDIGNTYIMMTAEEATAVTLHEIGHCLSIVIGMIYNGYVGITVATRLEELRNNIKRTGDSDTFFDNLVKDLDNDFYNLPDTTNRYIIDKIKRFRESENISEEGIVITSIAISGMYFAGVLPTFLAYLILAHLLISSTSSLFKMFRINDALYNDKNARSLITDQNIYMNERWADEYVSKMGYSDALATFLVKMRKISIGDDDNNNSKQIIRTNIKALSVLNVQKKYFNRFGYYEDFEDRINRLVQNNIAFLKKSNIDDKVKKEILDQNYQIKLIVNNIKKNNKKPLLSKIFTWKWFDKVTDMLISKTALSDNYKKIFNEIDDLMNNPIYEASYKVKQLVDKLSE